MGSLPIILFLLGVVFLILGWRWQNPPNEEAMTALKGLAYLKREVLRVQDQVQVLEVKLQTAQKIDLKESVSREIDRREIERKEIERKAIECKEIERKETERKETIRVYPLKSKELREKVSGGGVELKRNISPKYHEVLDLAAKGYSIPEIAQHLLLSQDAVMMVLKTQSKGVAR